MTSFNTDLNFRYQSFERKISPWIFFSLKLSKSQIFKIFITFLKMQCDTKWNLTWSPDNSFRRTDLTIITMGLKIFWAFDKRPSLKRTYTSWTQHLWVDLIRFIRAVESTLVYDFLNAKEIIDRMVIHFQQK